MKKFSQVCSRNDLADLLGIKRSHLTYVLYKKGVDSFYTCFEIPKKSGGTRQISAPTGILKTIQKRLARALWKYQEMLRVEKNVRVNISHAFEKKKSIVTNAQIHRNKYLVLNLDLEHFFESFYFGRIYGYFEKNKDFLLPHDAAIVVAQLTCYQGHLPQGAPTSPIITNLICQIFDMRILKIAKRYKLDYTRYADDLTFSTNDRSFLERQQSFLQELEKEINRAGFSINHTKTRSSLHDSQQTVTGLVVNQKLHVSSDYYRKTRAMAFQLYSHGSYEIDGKEGTIAQLEGRFSFINQLEHYNNKLDGKKHSFRSLNGREQQYRKFLFYKYFYAHEKPLIVTEGKTDIRYLKAALKKMWNLYPDLISKDSDGKFCYKINFLRRTNRLSYFLGIVQDGANTMKNIYNYFSDNNNYEFPNYYTSFAEIRRIPSQQPVILLFDNEMNSKRPLADFLKHVKNGDMTKEAIRSKLFARLLPEGNLYLLTNPLCEDKEECEIEYLFQPETRAKQLDGKTLCLKDDFDTKKHYGKEIFSEYIAQNYMQIDFTRFGQLLDTLSSIVKECSKG